MVGSRLPKQRPLSPCLSAQLCSSTWVVFWHLAAPLAPRYARAPKLLAAPLASSLCSRSRPTLRCLIWRSQRRSTQTTSQIKIRPNCGLTENVSTGQMLVPEHQVPSWSSICVWSSSNLCTCRAAFSTISFGNDAKRRWRFHA